jgi:hypothetical protein
VKIVPLSKVNAAGSSTMLQSPPGVKSIVIVDWKVPVPADRLLVAAENTVTSTSEHEVSRKPIRHVNGPN